MYCTGATGNSNTRAAKIRQNAQLLLTSPLSEWLTAGAHMHQQQLSGGLPTGHSSGPNTHSTPLLESVGTEQICICDIVNLLYM